MTAGLRGCGADTAVAPCWVAARWKPETDP